MLCTATTEAPQRNVRNALIQLIIVVKTSKQTITVHVSDVIVITAPPCECLRPMSDTQQSCSTLLREKVACLTSKVAQFWRVATNSLDRNHLYLKAAYGNFVAQQSRARKLLNFSCVSDIVLREWINWAETIAKVFTWLFTLCATLVLENLCSRRVKQTSVLKETHPRISQLNSTQSRDPLLKPFTLHSIPFHSIYLF